MLPKVSRLFTYLMAISLTLGLSPIVNAQATPVEKAENQSSLLEASSSPCSNLDVIFIIDQSASMSGGSGGPANDPTQQRKNAVDGMIDLLVDLSMDQCPGSYHRIGVISFGDEGRARIDLPLSDISPRNPEDAQSLREELKSKVVADNLGQTYPEQAFEDAWEMFEFSASAGGDEPRKRVILFVTDGFPCIPDGPCDPNRYQESTNSLRELVGSRFNFTESLRRREECLANLRSIYGDEEIPVDESTGCLEDNPVSIDDYKESTYIFTILLRNSGQSVPTLAQNVLAEMSEDYAGELISLRRNAEDIPTTLRRILSQLAGVRPNLLDCGGFAVNPYLKKAIVTAYKTSPDVQITLAYVDANNVRHEIQGGGPSVGFNVDPRTGYYGFGANERYEFLNPYPGIWEMTSTNCEGIDVYYDEIEIVPSNSTSITQIPKFDRDPFYNPDDAFFLKYQLLDATTNGEVVPQSDKEFFAIDVRANVILPNGEQNEYILKWASDIQTFVADRPLLVPVDGTYQYTITGTSRRHDGNPTVLSQNESQVFNQTYEVFKLEDVEFKVLDVLPVVISPVSPLADESIGNVHATILGGWPLDELPFDVRVKMADENGNALSNIDDVLVTPGNSIQAVLRYTPPPSPQDPGIEPTEMVSQPITLSPDPENPGEFVGSIPDFAYEGLQALTLSISSESLEPGYWVYDRSVDVPFTRTDCLFCRAGTYYAILAMIISIIILMIIYNIAIRTNKVSGSLIFLDGSTTIAEFGLYSGVNFRNIKKRELDGYPQLMLQSMKARNIGKKQRTTNQEGEGMDAFYSDSDDQKGIRIDCVSTNGRKFSVDLYPKTPSIYSDETFAQMVYEPIE
jgi:hypothetical protein